jgi:hypothetical protein
VSPAARSARDGPCHGRSGPRPSRRCPCG